MGFPSPDTFLKSYWTVRIYAGYGVKWPFITYDSSKPVKQLARLGTRYEPYAFRNFKENKRYAILVVYLLQLAQELTDKSFEIHDRQILSLLSQRT